MGIIYAHRHTSTGRTYIGQTKTTIEERSGEHGRNYVYGKPTKFAGVILYHGWKEFEHIVLCEVDDKYLDIVESYCIIEFDTFKNSLNSTVGGFFKENEKELSPNSSQYEGYKIELKRRLSENPEIRKIVKRIQFEKSEDSDRLIWKRTTHPEHPYKNFETLLTNGKAKEFVKKISRKEFEEAKISKKIVKGESYLKFPNNFDFEILKQYLKF